MRERERREREETGRVREKIEKRRKSKIRNLEMIKIDEKKKQTK